MSTRRVPLKTNAFHILLSLADGAQHGYAIMQDVLERTDGTLRLWPATLYGTLRRLVDDGLIEEGSPVPDDDARRRVYQLTSHGRSALSAEIRHLEALVRTARGKRHRFDLETSK